jgi:hypothetical protein
MATDLATTRRSLHAVAELVLAGPQYGAHDEIKLLVRPYGFGTVTGPDIRLSGATVVRDDVVVTIDGKSAVTIARELGLTARELTDVYHEGSKVGLDEVLAVDENHAQYLADCYRAGDEALAGFDADAERVLWPEHFDVAIRVDGVNYGMSPGDAHVPEPYAYVGPDAVTDDPFWNAAFGAALPLGPEPDADAIATFFAAGRDLLG